MNEPTDKARRAPGYARPAEYTLLVLLLYVASQGVIVRIYGYGDTPRWAGIVYAPLFLALNVLPTGCQKAYIKYLFWCDGHDLRPLGC